MRSGSAQRLIGIDAARAFAFVGMAVAHFADPTGSDDPGWLQAVDGAADGRSAPLFCMLLGLGAGILSARGAPDRVVVRRGLALLVLGLAIWPAVDRVYLILPHYGVLLMLVPLLRRIPSRWMLPLAAVAFLVPSVITAVIDDHRLRASPQPSTLADVLDPVAIVRNLVWTGGYPLVGWVGFALVGLWVVRRPLAEARTQWALVAGGVAVALLQPALAAVTDASDAGTFLDASAHSNQTAWYVVASGTAVAVIGACLAIARRTPLLRPLAPLGRLALTAYLLHLAAGYFLWDWLDRELPPLATQLLIVVALVGVLGAMAALWVRRFSRGPVEALLRAVAD